MFFPKINATLALISIIANLVPVISKEQCVDGVGPVNTGKDCPCVSVDAKCTIVDERSEYAEIYGKKCSQLNVEADEDGNYPVVNVAYAFSICNDNDLDIMLNKKAKFFDWRRAKGAKKESIENPRVPLGGQVVESGKCLEERITFGLSAGNRYNVASQLEGVFVDERGNLKDDANDPYCYAYKFEPINIKRGLCKMSTDISCTVTNTNKSCQAFIYEHPECVDFQATFKWNACNLEPRDMTIKSKQSNVKLGKKVDGVTSFERIGQVQSLLPKGTCEDFIFARRYNTCSDEKVFFGINVQGTNTNKKYWYECQSFKFDNVFFNPIPAPTSSPAPTVSAVPTTAMPSKNPSSFPTVSESNTPSVSPSKISSLSPSELPSSAPGSSLDPTQEPSKESASDSEVPTVLASDI